MPPKINSDDLPSLLALYNHTHAKITRYRDIEWKNAGLFTASIAAIVGFILTQDIVHDFVIPFDIVLVSLAVGNISYNVFAHDRLTKQRNIRNRIEYILNFDEIQAKTIRFLPFDIIEPNCSFRKGWFRGFFDHIILFFLASAALAIFGIYYLHCYN